MNKFILTAFFSLVLIKSFGQSFPEDKPELLLNKVVRSR